MRRRLHLRCMRITASNRTSVLKIRRSASAIRAPKRWFLNHDFADSCFTLRRTFAERDLPVENRLRGSVIEELKQDRG